MTKPCIGIITVPLDPKGKHHKLYHSYIPTTHIDTLERIGCTTIAIPYTTATSKYQYYINRINGLYIPGGGHYASNNKTLYRCCKNMVKLALQKNRQGVHFPVWGACMGMQLLLMIADDTDNFDLLKPTDSFKNLMLEQYFPSNPRTTKLFRTIDTELLLKLQMCPCALNNHKMGMSPADFYHNKKISNFYRLVSTSKDRQGQEFVSIIEAHNYPFYGFQWHPEQDPKMDPLISVFYQDATNNTAPCKLLEADRLPCVKILSKRNKYNTFILFF